MRSDTRKPRRIVRSSEAAPIYHQVARALEREFRASALSGRTAALPSENQLSKEFGVSRITIRHALDQLEDKGLIYRKQGKGSFPATPRLKDFTGLRSFSEEVEFSQGAPTSRIISQGHVDHLPEAMLQHVSPPTEDSQGFWRLHRVRLIDNLPVAIEEAHLPTGLYPGIQEVDFTGASLFQTMREIWGVVPAWADAVLEPIAASDAEAELLGVDAGAPLMIAWRVSSTEQDEVAEYVESTYRGGGFTLSINRYKLGRVPWPRA